MMKCIFKSPIWKLLSLALLSISFMKDAKAGIDTYNCYPEKYQNVYKEQANPEDSEDIKSTKLKFIQLKQELDKLCNESDDKHFDWGYTSQSNLENHIKEDGKWNEYQAKLKQLEPLFNTISNLKASDKACGDKFPYGCPAGTFCYSTTKYQNVDNALQQEFITYSCEKDGYSSFGARVAKVGSSSVGSAVSSYGAGAAIARRVDSDGNAQTETFTGSEVSNVDEFIATGEKPVEVEKAVTDKLTNASCRIDELHEEYMSTCYSCIVVSALIGVFMQVVDQLEPLMQLAGLKLLVLAMLLWLPYFVLKKVMSMVSVEPMEMLQELFQFLFKCLVAYALITSGIKIVSQLMVNPLLGAGADYGISIIDSVMPKTVKATDKLSSDSKQYKIASSNNLDGKVFDKIMQISKKADAAVSLNFVIGNALFCHSHNAGALFHFEKLNEVLKWKLVIPDFWIMLCGACIWVFALFVTFAVNFYLLDLSFKIGFALLALPVTLGLWPISKFEGLCIKCLKVIVNAAGTFMFLGITTGFSIALINASIGGTDNLLTYIKNNDQVSVSRVFGFTSGAFLLVVFAFYYSYKLISGTVEKFADKLFSCDFSGMTPMHHKAVGLVSMGGSAASNLGSWVHRKTTQKAFNAVGYKVNNMAKNTARSAIGGVRKGINKLRGR